MSNIKSYSIDGVDLYTLFGFVVEEGSDGLLIMPKSKPVLSKSWGDEDGTEYFLNQRFFEDKVLELSGTIIAADDTDFWLKYNGLWTLLKAPGERTLYSDETGFYYQCFYDEMTKANRITRLKGGNKVGVKISIKMVILWPGMGTGPSGNTIFSILQPFKITTTDLAGGTLVNNPGNVVYTNLARLQGLTNYPVTASQLGQPLGLPLKTGDDIIYDPVAGSITIIVPGFQLLAGEELDVFSGRPTVPPPPPQPAPPATIKFYNYTSNPVDLAVLNAHPDYTPLATFTINQYGSQEFLFDDYPDKRIVILEPSNRANCLYTENQLLTQYYGFGSNLNQFLAIYNNLTDSSLNYVLHLKYTYENSTAFINKICILSETP